jgi:hypothetical protein
MFISESSSMSFLGKLVRNADEAGNMLRGSDDVAKGVNKYNIDDYPRGAYSIKEEVAKILDDSNESHIVPPLNKTDIIDNEKLPRDELVNIDWKSDDAYSTLNNDVNNLLEQGKIVKVASKIVSNLSSIPKIEFLRAVWSGGRISQYYKRQSDRENAACEGLKGRVTEKSNIYLMNDFEIYIHGTVNESEVVCIIGKEQDWYVIPYGFIERKNINIETNDIKKLEDALDEFIKKNKAAGEI